MSLPLQKKNTRLLLTWLPLVILSGSVFFYIVMRGHILHTQEQELRLKQDNIWLAFSQSPGSMPLHIAGEYDLSHRTFGSAGLADRPRDTAVIYPDGKEVTFNILTLQHTLNGADYQLTTYISSKEVRHLIIKVGIAEAIIFMILLLAIVIINRRTSSRLWKPFYATMNAVRDFDIRQNKPLSLEITTGTEEFDRLNKALLDLINHVDQAYRNQKQFTENASHELQTPLAIIRSKVELLMEDPSLNENSAQLLQEITEANERLSQMNKNLLLLTRNDNGQYPEVHPVNISLVLERQTNFLKEYYVNEGVKTNAVITYGIEVSANPALIEILLNNLLRNAYIHNVPGGWVDIHLSANDLIIKNSGLAIEGDPEQLFDRFRKGRTNNQTTGLGLALVRQIGQLYHYDICYTYHESVHQLRVSFS